MKIQKLTKKPQEKSNNQVSLDNCRWSENHQMPVKQMRGKMAMKESE